MSQINHDELKARIRKSGDFPPESKRYLEDALDKAHDAYILEKRLKHLLESDFIRQFDSVSPATKEYIVDIREADKAEFVQRGKWEPVEADGYDPDGNLVWDYWECSICGHEHSGDCDTLTAFCPNCGARMEGGTQNEP